LRSRSENVETITHMNKIQKWGEKWNIKLNPQKSIVIIFTNRRPKTSGNLKLYDNSIPWSSNIKYLSVILDKKLTWNPYISFKLQQDYQRLKIQYPLINRQTSLSWKCSLMIYKQILRPLLLYAVYKYSNLKFWG